MPTWKPVTMHLGQYFTILAAYRIAYWSAMACLTLMVNGQLSIQPLKHHMPAIVDRCSIPDDHIDPRRSSFFMARSILREVREGVGGC